MTDSTIAANGTHDHLGPQEADSGAGPVQGTPGVPAAAPTPVAASALPTPALPPRPPLPPRPSSDPVATQPVVSDTSDVSDVSDTSDTSDASIATSDDSPIEFERYMQLQPPTSGEGVQHDLQTVVKTVDEAADAGHPLAKIETKMLASLRGEWKFTGGGDRTVDGIRSQASKDDDSPESAGTFSHVNARIKMAMLYRYGVGVPQDNAEAIAYMTAAARSATHGTDARLWLGICSELGMGMPRDLAQAAAWYEDAGITDGPVLAADLYAYGGEGLPADPARAFGLYLKAMSFGAKLEDGQKDFMRQWSATHEQEAPAITELKEIAQSDQDARIRGNAMHSLAVCYTEGYGVVRDPAQALAYRMQGAEEGDNTQCRQELADGYREGRDGLPVDLGRASYWSARAKVSSTKPETWIAVGDHYADGVGVPADLQKAAECYRKACGPGNTRNPKEIANMLGEWRQLVMNPELPYMKVSPQGAWLIAQDPNDSDRLGAPFTYVATGPGLPWGVPANLRPAQNAQSTPLPKAGSIYAQRKVARMSDTEIRMARIYSNGTLPLPPEKKHTGLFGRLFGRK